MEECPKCKKWTLYYNPRIETMLCGSCDYQEPVKYESFIKQRNIVESLHYPSLKETKIARVKA